MFNIKLGDKTYEGVEKVKLNTTDGSTATFIGEGIDPIKAFVTSPPTVSEFVAKNVAAIPVNFQYVREYTNTATSISVEFNYGNVGDTLVLALATRNPSAEPAVPPGWTKAAWISPHAGSMSNQWVLVATTVTDENTAGTVGTVTFDVATGSRHYLMVINTKDSKIDVTNPIISKAGTTRYVKTELFENTLLICSSETTITTTGNYPTVKTWIKDGGGYSVDYFPSYSDDYAPGGRLAMLYVPFKSQQPFLELNLEYSNSRDNSNSMLLCALNVTPGKQNLQYACVF